MVLVEGRLLVVVCVRVCVCVSFFFVGSGGGVLVRVVRDEQKMEGAKLFCVTWTGSHGSVIG